MYKVDELPVKALPLYTVEEDEKEKMFKIFMDANHLGHATAFGSIGYDGERDIFTFLLMTLRLSLQNYQ